MKVLLLALDPRLAPSRLRVEALAPSCGRSASARRSSGKEFLERTLRAGSRVG